MGMGYKIKYLPRMVKDIHEVGVALEDYPAKAKRLLKEMDEKLQILKEMPFMWPVFKPRPKYRKMVLEEHLLFYTVDEDRHEVKVHRILYEKKDATRHLK